MISRYKDVKSQKSLIVVVVDFQFLVAFEESVKVKEIQFQKVNATL